MSSQQVAAESTEVSPEQSLLQDELTQLFEPLPAGPVLRPAPWSAWWPLLEALQNIILFLVLESPNVFSQHCKTQGKAHLPGPAGYIPAALCNWKPSRSCPLLLQDKNKAEKIFFPVLVLFSASVAGISKSWW